MSSPNPDSNRDIVECIYQYEAHAERLGKDHPKTRLLWLLHLILVARDMKVAIALKPLVSLDKLAEQMECAPKEAAEALRELVAYWKSATGPKVVLDDFPRT
jgi:hypothetical protein